MIRPGNVAWLAECYRHKGRSALADLELANRHANYTREECRDALARVMAEATAALTALGERERFSADPVSARLEALLLLSDAGLEELDRAGLLDNLGGVS